MSVDVCCFGDDNIIANYFGKVLRFTKQNEARVHDKIFILDEVLAINNKRNQLKIKGIKVYSSKQ